MGFLIIENLEDELTVAFYQRLKQIRKDLESLNTEDKKSFLMEIEKKDYNELNDPWREYLKLESLKLLNALTPMENRLLLEVEHYRLIPGELREFLESNPLNMFKLGIRLRESVKAQQTLTELKQLFEHLNCNDCSEITWCQIHRIMKEIISHRRN